MKMKAKLIKKQESWYNLYDGDVGIGSTYEELQGYKLSIKNCQAIERGYDLDELVIDYIGEPDKKHWHPVDHNDFVAFKDGFEKALELMGDKKFSEEDVISMIEKSRETGLTAQYLILTKQQTEWNVEIEMENSFESFRDGTIKPLDIPKLDENGCLILKRI